MFERERPESRRLIKYGQGGLELIIAALLLALNGCATEHVIVEQEPSATVQVPEAEAEVSDEEEPADPDPLEGFNRAMYSFNETVDTYVAEPITDVYRWAFPQFVQTGVSNFYANMRGIGVMLNDFLQAKFKQGASDTGRFALNTTIGLAGLIDVAGYVGLEQHDEDFGQTLAVWGVPSGPYLVLPFVGPGTVREIPGSIVDAAVHPATYLPVGFAAVGALNRRANAEESLKFIDEAALDPYVFTRESYLQFREHQITDGEAGASADIGEFDEELFVDEEFDDEASNAEEVETTVVDSEASETIEVDVVDVQSEEPVAGGTEKRLEADDETVEQTETESSQETADQDTDRLAPDKPRRRTPW